MRTRKAPIARKKPLRRSKPMTAKQKTCRECGFRGRIWTAGLCRKCADLKSKSPKENGTITKEMVHQVFSWLVRTVYPNYCHACKRQFPYKFLQCCHMVPRGNMITTWDLRNCYPGCETCNYHDPTHEILLSYECDKYWGYGTAAHMAIQGQREYHWAPFELEELYKIFMEALREAEQPGADKEAIRYRVLEATKRAA